MTVVLTYKNWKESLTIWFNAIAAVLFEAEQMLGVFKEIVGDTGFYRGYAITVLIANILIRVYKTKTAIGRNNQQPPEKS